MKVSSITTTLQKPAKRILPFVAGAMALVGCQDNYTKIKDYCLETGKTQKEFEMVEKSQRGLDSLIYRDIFNGTTLAKDSTALVEFNKTVSKNKSIDKDYFNNLKNEASIRDYQNIHEHSNPVRRQYEADKYMYTKFFQEQGLMPQVADKLVKAYDFLAPHMAYTYYDTFGSCSHDKAKINILTITKTDACGLEQNIVKITTTKSK